MILALAVCAALAGLSASAGAAGPREVRVGPVPRPPTGSSATGALSGTTSIHVTVALKPRDPAALASYATAVSTPGSSVYHRYLTVAEFRQRFGPTNAQIAAVLDSLRAHGLKPGAATANGLAIPVGATAGALARAFSTSFEHLRLRSGRGAFVNRSAPLLDASIAGLVQGVVGLDSLAVARPLALHPASGLRARGRTLRSAHVATGGPQPCPAATAAASAQYAYTADQIASAYNFSGLYGANDFGAGQTVAIFELEGNFPADINAFKQCYGITTGTASYTQVDGGPGTPNVANQDGVETELDMENVIGLARGANVHVYQGPYWTNATDANIYDTYNAMVTSGAQVLSTSWGLCEPGDTTGPLAESTLFQEAATQGQSVFAAAGDSGSEDCGGNTSLSVDDPGSQPYVTSAGGTSLTTLGPPPVESVWNDACGGGPCGGGGGISELWQMPSYQTNAPAGLHVINSNSSGASCGAPAGKYCREVPDVSADADPATGYVIYWNGSWTGIGGTSGSAPLWAGLMADVNASTACSGTTVGFANPALYDAAASSYSGDFNDITVGNNDVTGTNGGLYPAGAGYDMASGLGTPNAANLAATLCGDLVTVTYPGAQASDVNRANPSITPLQITAGDSASKTLTYSAAGLPPGLSIGSSSGLISGKPTTAGTYNVTVTATASDGVENGTTFAWTISTPISITDPGAQTSVAGASVSLPIAAVDADPGTTLAYSAAATLPPGLSIDSSTGVISGKPTTPGSYPVTITAADGVFTDTTQFTWTVNPASVTITPPGNQVGIVGVAESLQAQASDNNAGTLSYSATGLPPGLTINSSSGLITGTPTSTGSSSVTLTAHDGASSASTTFSWTIAAATVAIANPGSQIGRVGSGTMLQLHGADNNGGALSYTASGLPPGLAVNPSTGQITGTPSRAGSYSVSASAADGASSAAATFTWTVAGLPTATGALTGVATGKPKLTLTVTAGAHAPAVKSVVLTLPSVLRFTSKGLKLNVKGYKLKRSGAKLTITLKSAVSVLRIAIVPVKLHHKTTKKLSVTVKVTDASGFGSTATLKLKGS